MSMFDLQSTLTARKAENLYRYRSVRDSAQGPEVYADKERQLSFCSNDYLGLANHPQVIDAFKKGADIYGTGSGSSHLINGHSRPHHALEEALAEFTGRPRALLFSTGYMANIGVISALMTRGDAVFEDKLNHASLLDAGLLSGARFQRYRHCDVDNLEKQLMAASARRKLIVTDGVFSMDGNIAPLPQLAAAAKKHGSWLMVDDAHGFGVLGATGAGCTESYQMSMDDVPVLMGTLGKAFGTMGAFVAGSEALIETLIQFSRTYIYTTALPPAIASATLASLKIAQKETWRREKLQLLISQFKSGCQSLDLNIMPSDTPVQPILTGDAHDAMAFSDILKKQQIQVTAIRPPSVPVGTSRLRVTLSASHTEAHVEQLLNALEQAQKIVSRP